MISDNNKKHGLHVDDDTIPPLDEDETPSGSQTVKKKASSQISKPRHYISREFIDALVRDANFAELLRQDGHKLRASGTDTFQFSCFAHQPDNKPSMQLKLNHCKCFACGWRGNIIDYLNASRNLSFRDAINFVAQDLGRKIPYSNQPPNRKVPLHETFIGTIERIGQKASEVKVLLDSKPLSTAGIGFLPENLGQYSRFLAKQPREYLEAAGIKSLSNGVYKGPNAYIWILRSGEYPVGITRFNMHRDSEQGVSAKFHADGKHENGFFTERSGVAIGQGAGLQWQAVKLINVCDDPVDAINFHSRAQKIGPGAYIPLPKERTIEDEVYDELMRHKRVRFVSREERAQATFALRSLDKVRDGQEIYMAVPKEKGGGTIYMSRFVLEWIASKEDGARNGKVFAKALAGNTKEADCYRKVLGEQLEKAIQTKEKGRDDEGIDR